VIGAGVRMLVVGAGLGGLGAARALRQRGFAAPVPAVAGSHGPVLQPSNCAHLVVSGGAGADTARIT
jgi:hypothetical protein